MGSVDLFNTDAEALFLAAVLQKPESYWSLNDVGLVPEDFLGTENRRVMKAVAAVVGDRKNPELPFILEELRMDDANGTVEYAQRLMAVPCSPAQAREYAQTIKGLSTSRHLATAGAKIIELAKEHRANADVAMSEAEAELRRVRSTLPAEAHSPDPADILRALRQQGPRALAPIRLSPTLHQITGGFVPGRLWVIGGFSSTGKSAVACNLAADVLRERDTWVGMVSTEMSRETYGIRMLSLLSGIPQRMIENRLPMTLEQTETLRKAEQQFAGSNLRVWDTLYRWNDIRSKAVQMKETLGLDVLFVDYLQNVRGETGDEYSDITNISVDMLKLAKELGIVVITFSQLSNEMAKYASDPKSDENYYAFKGSGAIKDTADLAILLQRDRARQSPFLDWKVKKNRNGESGLVITTTMDLPTGRIEERYLDEDVDDSNG